MSERFLRFRVTVVVEPDGDGFHAYCPALKGLHVPGDTEEEALKNAKDAVDGYLRSLIRHGDPVPIGASPNGKPISRRGLPWFRWLKSRHRSIVEFEGSVERPILAVE